MPLYIENTIRPRMILLTLALKFALMADPSSVETKFCEEASKKQDFCFSASFSRLHYSEQNGFIISTVVFTHHMMAIKMIYS